MLLKNGILIDFWGCVVSLKLPPTETSLDPQNDEVIKESKSEYRYMQANTAVLWTDIRNLPTSQKIQLQYYCKTLEGAHEQVLKDWDERS